MLDGVFTEAPGGALAFHPAPAPSEAEVAAALATIRHRVQRLLVRHRLEPADDATGPADRLAEESPVLAGNRGRLRGGRIQGRLQILVKSAMILLRRTTMKFIRFHVAALLTLLCFSQPAHSTATYDASVSLAFIFAPQLGLTVTATGGEESVTLAGGGNHSEVGFTSGGGGPEVIAFQAAVSGFASSPPDSFSRAAALRLNGSLTLTNMLEVPATFVFGVTTLGNLFASADHPREFASAEFSHLAHFDIDDPGILGGGPLDYSLISLPFLVLGPGQQQVPIFDTTAVLVELSPGPHTIFVPLVQLFGAAQSSIPEPSTFSLVAVGLVLLIGCSRRGMRI